MAHSFLDKEFYSPNQSGFKPGYSCINQLLNITHEIHKGLNDGLEVREVFPDISIAVDKVLHRRLLYKLRLNGISGNLLKLPESFLVDRKQRVSLNG